MEHSRQTKRWNIIIAVIMATQAVVMLLFLMFAVYQKKEVEVLRRTADMQYRIASTTVDALKDDNVKMQKTIDSLTTELEKLKAIVENK